MQGGDIESGKYMRFLKIEGCGNSFVTGDAHLLPPDVDPAMAVRMICSPSFGVGADGVMLVAPRERDLPFRVDMYNSDGSKAAMCGNGIRCVVRYLCEEGRVDGEGPTPVEIPFLVAGRPILCRTADRGRTVEVEMGPPSFDPAIVPVRSSTPMIDQPLESSGIVWRATALSMGNPHCVIFDEQGVVADEELFRTYGSALEQDPRFPDRVNVEFVVVESPSRLRVLVWERGVGFTLACGTGACAAVAAGYRTGRCARAAEVVLPGGVLLVRWEGDTEEGGSLVMTGPTRVVCEGQFWPEAWQVRA
jgi:diaminopimelate epimerase